MSDISEFVTIAIFQKNCPSTLKAKTPRVSVLLFGWPPFGNTSSTLLYMPSTLPAF